MTQYINKDALVAEIKKLSAYLDSLHEQRLIEKILSIIDTLDVREVGLEKEYKNFIKSDNGRSMFETAKHFFELGLKVAQNEQKSCTTDE